MNIYPLKYTNLTRSNDYTDTFPKIWESREPIINKYVMQKLIELEQEVKELKEKLNKIKL